jgi:molecular chaperone DnaK
MDRIFGIDLGTTNSVISHTDVSGVTEVIAGTDGGRIVPSVIYFPKDGDPVVGALARQRTITEPERVAKLFKRGMGERTFLPNGEPFVVDDKTWSPEELSSLVLRKLAGMAEQHYGEPARRAIITVPAYFGEAERAATQSAGELAGLEVLRILNEPTAAALAHGLDHPKEPGRILVFDLGGGTFDVTVMEVSADGKMTVVATGGDRKLGGMDFDELVVHKMVQACEAAGLDITTEAWAKQDAYLKAEDIKIELSSLDAASRSLTGSGRPLQFDMSRREFEKLLTDKLREVEDTCRYTIDEAGVQPSDLTTVLMVGGSSRIPAFQELLARVCGRKPSFSRNLDEDVARGAAILAAKLGGELDPRSHLAQMPPPVDVTSHGLGVTVMDQPTRRIVNSIVIPAQTEVPVTREETYWTVEDGQTHVKVDLNEGDDEDLQYVKQLATGTGSFGRPVRKDHPVRVELSFSEDQIIHLTAFDGETGSFLCELDVERPGNLSKSEKLQVRSLLTSMEIR